MDLGLISESYEPSGADPRGAQIPLYSIETSDFGLWPIYTYIEDFRKTRRPSNRRAEAHMRHMDIRVRLESRSIPNRYTLTPHALWETHFSLFLTRRRDGNILQRTLEPHRHDIRPNRSGNFLQLFVRLTFGVVIVHIRF